MHLSHMFSPYKTQAKQWVRICWGTWGRPDRSMPLAAMSFHSARWIRMELKEQNKTERETLSPARKTQVMSQNVLQWVVWNPFLGVQRGNLHQWHRWKFPTLWHPTESATACTITCHGFLQMLLQILVKVTECHLVRNNMNESSIWPWMFVQMLLVFQACRDSTPHTQGNQE